MKITTSKLNAYMFFKLPAAFWCGVRAKHIDTSSCVATVKYKWINQNPFKSMYFAVQAMAAEFTTGALLLASIQQSGRSISMLVAQNNSVFSKKAIGRITFTCNDSEMIKEAIQNTIATGEGQTVWMQSKGVNEKGEVVSTMNFQWTIKLKD